MRDSQKQKVYDWERDLGIDETPSMTPRDIRALADEVCEDFGRKPLQIHHSRGSGIARGGPGYIKLPRWARHKRIVLHEIAHALHVTDPGHGPEFARFLAELFERYAGIPMSVLRKKATEHRVRWAPAAACPKPLTRVERRLKADVKRTRAAYDEAVSALSAYRARRRA